LVLLCLKFKWTINRIIYKLTFPDFGLPLV
jgi:hypothetical protein